MTPHLVGLASELEGSPFHLVAQHCQKDTRENVVAYVRSKGLAAETPNVTVTSFGRHPKVKGNGYVPYSMVFDHHGDLVYHHMSGDYHGGDGLELLDVVRRLLADVPEIYLGKAPFVHFAELAARVEAGKDLGKLEAEILSLREAAGSNEQLAELDRLQQALEGLRDRALAEFEALLRDDPASFGKHSKMTLKRFRKTSFEPGLEARVEALEPLVKPSQKIDKQLASVAKRLAKLKPCETCDRARAESHQLGCPHCARANEKSLGKLADELETLLTEAGDLPIAKRVASRLAELRS